MRCDMVDTFIILEIGDHSNGAYLTKLKNPAVKLRMIPINSSMVIQMQMWQLKQRFQWCLLVYDHNTKWLNKPVTGILKDKMNYTVV